jgi:hypothetical protein
MGDLSENGDYHAAKEEKGKMEGRIMHLEHLLENTTILDGCSDGNRHGCSLVASCRSSTATTMNLSGCCSVPSRSNMPTSAWFHPALLSARCSWVDRWATRISFEAPGGELTVRITAIEH